MKKMTDETTKEFLRQKEEWLNEFCPELAYRHIEIAMDIVKEAIEFEREACARLCDGWTHADGDQCAEAIRARGNDD